MVGHSLDVAVLARIIAPSTAEVTALMWSGDPLAGVCADALPNDSAMPRPNASATPAKRLGRLDCEGIVGKDGQAKAACGERIISVPSQAISNGSREIVCLGKARRQSNARCETQKRKFLSPSFRQTKCRWHLRCSATS